MQIGPRTDVTRDRSIGVHRPPAYTGRKCRWGRQNDDFRLIVVYISKTQDIVTIEGN